jgi:hypothetical protein
MLGGSTIFDLQLRSAHSPPPAVFPFASPFHELGAIGGVDRRE